MSEKKEQTPEVVETPVSPALPNEAYRAAKEALVHPSSVEVVPEDDKESLLPRGKKRMVRRAKSKKK